jgi:hypothetical protein
MNLERGQGGVKQTTTPAETVETMVVSTDSTGVGSGGGVGQ